MRPTEEWLTRPGGLADELRSIREAVRPRLTAEELARRAHWPRTKVSKLQNGQQMPSPEDIRAWCEISGRPEEIPRLLELREEAQTVHRQFRHQRGGHAEVQRELDRLTRQARMIRNVEITLIPGLLQTPGYARYPLTQIMQLTGDQRDPAEAVHARMGRQRILYEPGREFEFILFEAALRMKVCPDTEMTGQLDHLLSAISMPNATLRIVPAAELVPIIPVNSYMQLDDVTYEETFTSENLLRGTEAARYDRVTEILRAGSVTGDEARDLIMASIRLLRP